jgi:ATP-dependent helicase/nuclease subunit B
MSIPEFQDQSFDIPRGVAAPITNAPSTARLSPKHPLLPQKISPSSYKQLRECPYRFYVSKSLGLHSPKSLADESEFGIVGNLLHKILKEFYEQVSELYSWEHFAESKEAIEKLLIELSISKWTDLINLDGKFLFHQKKWLEQVPEFIAWQINHLQQGWKYYGFEKKFTFEVMLEDQQKVLLVGQVDRIDIGSDSAMVIDYKVQNYKKIEEKKKTIKEDPQLIFYALGLENSALSHQLPIKTVQWVSLKSDKTDKAIDVSLDLDESLIEETKKQFIKDLSAVWQGKTLPANGPNHICQYCEFRGICRKGMWNND